MAEIVIENNDSAWYNLGDGRKYLFKKCAEKPKDYDHF